MPSSFDKLLIQYNVVVAFDRGCLLMTEEHKVRFMFEGSSSLLGCCEALLFAQYLLLLPGDCFVSYSLDMD